MKTTVLIFTLALAMLASMASVYAQEESALVKADIPELRKGSLLKELPASVNNSPKKTPASGKDDTEPAFKPSIQVGSIVHMFASTEQTGFGAPGADKASSWNKGFSLYRARVLVGGQLSRKGSFFLETDIPSVIGTRKDSSNKNVKVSAIILDCQYEHKFSEAFQVIAGMQLVSNNRNGLQGAAALMANDFTFFQYPYNLFSDSPLQGNFGRDLGVNLRGYVLKDRLEYRLGVFTGRNIDGKAPLRTVGRLAYNFLDPEKDYYYAGTKLGNGQTAALGAGFDAQGTYYNLSTDLFIDKPLGKLGSVTLNAAFQYMTGGTDINSRYSFATLIPKQTVQFLELGYYFSKIKVQPWVRFENQSIASTKEQVGTMNPGDFDKQHSSTVYGGGVNYFFNGLGTNVRLSYTARQYNIPNDNGGFTNSKPYGQVWAQLQFFIF